jgi:hypothetical protein
VLQQQLPTDNREVARTVVAAFRSEADLSSHYLFKAAPDPSAVSEETLALVFAQRLAVPEEEDADKALAHAIELSSDEAFREHRMDLYKWQHEVIESGFSSERALSDLDKKVRKYNEHVQLATKKVYYKYAFTIANIGIGLARATAGDPLALASGILAIAQFATFDRKPVLQPGTNGPAAMFHDVQSHLYKKIRWA